MDFVHSARLGTRKVFTNGLFSRTTEIISCLGYFLLENFDFIVLFQKGTNRVQAFAHTSLGDPFTVSGAIVYVP